MERMTVLAVVLARAGSKGVPGKNAVELGGKACAAWVIEDALGAARVDRVVVSTDCEKVAGVARGMGVTVVDRPGALAGDQARVDDALRHCVGTVEEGGETVGAVVMLYGNVPCKPKGLVDEAVELLLESGCDSVQSYTGVGKYHPWWQVRVGADGRVSPWEGEELFHGVFRRQDLPASYVPDGGVTVVLRDVLMGSGGGGPHDFLGVDRRGVVTEEGSVVDIDSEADVARARFVIEDRLRAAGERGGA